MIKLVLELPPRLSVNILVSLLSLYGIKLLLSVKALITLPRQLKD